MKLPKNELTQEPVMLRILKELKEQGKTGKELEEALGLGNGAFSKWKYQKGNSYMKYLGNIAEFLNVTPEYLKNEPEKEVQLQNMTKKEMNIIFAYRNMGTEEKTCMLQMIKFLMNSSELRKCKEIERGNESNSIENPLS
jgi:transcriptional regulator with XRE-family HTH domain